MSWGRVGLDGTLASLPSSTASGQSPAPADGTVPSGDRTTVRPVVALLLRDFDGGGAERALINLANGLLECDIEVDLLVSRDSGAFRRYVAPGVRVIPLSNGQKASSKLLGVVRLARYLRRRRPARLVSTLEAQTIMAFLAHCLGGRRRDLIIRVATTFDREPRPLFRRILIPLVYRWHGGLFVANSAASAANLDASFAIGDRRLKVVYNAVDYESIQCFGAGEMEHGRPWGGDQPFLLFVGRLTAAKRVDVLLHAVALLRAPCDLPLVILGDGPLYAALAAQVAELGLEGRVWMPGFTANPYAYMTRAAALVLSSDYEGMPTVLIEALACGCPVVSTDCVSGPREVLEDGRWGELAPVGDASALAIAIQHTLERPRSAESLRKRARAFSIRAAAEAYVKILCPEAVSSRCDALAARETSDG